MSFSSALIAVHLASLQSPQGGIPSLPPISVIAMAQPPSDGAAIGQKDGDDVPTAPLATEATIVVTAAPEAPPGDPLEKVNVETFKVVQSVDKAITGPVARGYKKAVPSPIRSGLRNALRNLSEPVVALNYMLQLKPGKGVRTLGRFAINSTVGVAGLVDVAKRKPFDIPYCANGFAYTLGYYGVKTGPYMYLPLIGPTTVRDLAGRLADLSLLPVAVGKPFNDTTFALTTTTIRLVDERAEADDEIRASLANDDDPYAAIRRAYIQARQAEIDALRDDGGKGTPTTDTDIAQPCGSNKPSSTPRS